MKKLLFILISIMFVSSSSASPKAESGKLIEYKEFKSSIITPRDVWVWLPNNYSPKQRYDVVYMHDGQMLFDSTTTWNKQEWQADEVASKLISTGKTRPFIIVGVANIQADRFADYFPQKTVKYLSNQKTLSSNIKLNADNYLKFLVKELKPFIDKNYSTNKGVNNTFVMGSSMGGLISLYAICEYPKVFGGAACISIHSPMISPSATVNVSQDEVATAFRAYLKKNLPKANSRKIYMDRGDQTLDAIYPKYQDALDAIMKSAGWRAPMWVSRVFPNTAHREVDWAKRLDVPLIFLLTDYR